MLLNRLLSNRSRSTTTRTSGPDAGANWWQPLTDAGMLGIETDSGQTVGPEGSLSYHAWYRAMSLIAQKVAAIPKHLLKRSDDDDGKERDREHNVYRLVHQRANEEQTAFQFWLQMAGHTASRGNGYAAIYRVGGQVVELLPMNPDRTYPFRKDGKLWYIIYPFGHQGDGIRLRPVEILHFKGFGFDGLCGYPVWWLAKDEIGLGKAERKLSATRFKNNARPSMILNHPNKLEPKTKEKIISDWERMTSGVDNAGRTAILDAGLTATPISLSAEELEQSGAAQMSLVAISNFTGVPVSKLGGASKSGQSQEQEDTAFINDGLDFWLNVMEDESGAKLLTDDERKQGYEVKGCREALLRPDTKAKHEASRIALAGKPWKTQNEVRKDFDMPPSDDPDADKLLTPLNMGQGGIDNKPRNPADDGPGRPLGDENEDTIEQAEYRNASATTIVHATRKLVKRIAFHANRLSSKPTEFLALVDAMQAEHAKVFDEEMTPAEQSARAISFHLAGPSGWAGRWLLNQIHSELSTLSQSTPAKHLAEKVAALTAEQEKRLPLTMVNLMLGETR